MKHFSFFKRVPCGIKIRTLLPNVKRQAPSDSLMKPERICHWCLDLSCHMPPGPAHPDQTRLICCDTRFTYTSFFGKTPVWEWSLHPSQHRNPHPFIMQVRQNTSCAYYQLPTAKSYPNTLNGGWVSHVLCWYKTNWRNQQTLTGGDDLLNWVKICKWVIMEQVIFHYYLE